MKYEYQQSGQENGASVPLFDQGIAAPVLQHLSEGVWQPRAEKKVD